MDSSLFAAHFYDSHIQLFYKCTDCNRAFAEKTAIYAHRNEVHNQIEETETSKNNKKITKPDFSILYKASFLKAPHK